MQELIQLWFYKSKYKYVLNCIDFFLAYLKILTPPLWSVKEEHSVDEQAPQIQANSCWRMTTRPPSAPPLLNSQFASTERCVVMTRLTGRMWWSKRRKRARPRRPRISETWLAISDCKYLFCALHQCTLCFLCFTPKHQKDRTQNSSSQTPQLAIIYAPVIGCRAVPKRLPLCFTT